MQQAWGGTKEVLGHACLGSGLREGWLKDKHRPVRGMKGTQAEGREALLGRRSRQYTKARGEREACI